MSGDRPVPADAAGLVVPAHPRPRWALRGPAAVVERHRPYLGARVAVVTTRYVDPVLLAASDCLVLTALERAGARALPRAARAGERHTAYLRFPIAREKVDHALAGAWALAPLLAARHDLDLDVAAWCSVLDDYARALLLMTQPHTPAQLRPHLYPVAVSRPATRPYLEVAAG